MSVLRPSGFDTDYLVSKFNYYGFEFNLYVSICVEVIFFTDVIGILTGVGTERELNRIG